MTATTSQTSTDSSSTPSISVKIAFSGGLELLFNNRRTLLLTCPSPTSLSQLIEQLSSQCDQSRKELFVKDGSVRPGILVLVNEADWELEGEGAYLVQEGDEILFMSTLHGG